MRPGDYFLCMLKHPRLIIETSIYSEIAFIQENTAHKQSWQYLNDGAHKWTR